MIKRISISLVVLLGLALALPVHATDPKIEELSQQKLPPIEEPEIDQADIGRGSPGSAEAGLRSASQGRFHLPEPERAVGKDAPNRRCST